MRAYYRAGDMDLSQRLPGVENDFLCQLHPNRRILLMANSLSFAAYSLQNPPVLLTPESVCLAWDSPFPASAAAKGITHQACKQNRVPTGMLLAPIGNPAPRSCAHLDTPHIFRENGTQTVKMQFDNIPQKIQSRCSFCSARGCSPGGT